MTSETNRAGWTTAAILTARLIFALVFIMAVSFKLMNISGTAGLHRRSGFPAAHPSGLARGIAGARADRGFPDRGLFFRSGTFGRSLCAVPRLRVPWAFALGGKPGPSSGSSSIISHFLRAFCLPPAHGPGRRLGNATRMDYTAIARAMARPGFADCQVGQINDLTPRFSPKRGADRESSRTRGWDAVGRGSYD